MKEETGDGGCPKGTNLGYRHKTETKNKISIAKKGKPIYRSTAVSQETKIKISETLKGRKRSQESIKKQIQTRITNGTLKHSEETKAKLRKPISEETRKKRIANHTKPTKDCFWVNNGIEQKLAKILPEGWVVGRITKPIPPSQKGKIWITNGVLNKMSHEVPEGWWRGRS